MAKKPKKVEVPKPTPAKRAYLVALEGLNGAYESYRAGQVEDDDFPTPGKQKKVAKQIAKMHNRLNKKVAEFGIEDLSEELD